MPSPSRALASGPAARRHPSWLSALSGLAGAALLFGLATPAGATLLVYEPFAYPDGTILEDVPATGVNLTGDYTAPGVITGFELRAAAPGLDYGSLLQAPPATGQRLTQQTGTTAGVAVVSVGQDIIVSPGAAIYWSALLTLDDSLNGNHLANITFRDGATGDTIGFGEPAVGIRNLRVEAATAATGGLVADSTATFVDGRTLWMIGRYVNSAAAGADQLDLLMDDTADADAPAAIFDPADPAAEHALGLANLDIDMTTISSIVFTIRGTSNNFIDELRIGSTYASVVRSRRPRRCSSSARLLVVGVLGVAARLDPGMRPV